MKCQVSAINARSFINRIGLLSAEYIATDFTIEDKYIFIFFTIEDK